jgi:hypothetical protein
MHTAKKHHLMWPTARHLIFRSICHSVRKLSSGLSPHSGTQVRFQMLRAKNYPLHERELLDIVYVIKEWRPYLHGSCFVIKTDHHPLSNLDTQSNLSKKQMRWMKALQEYDYEIVYGRSKFNAAADALYRISESPSTELYMGREEDEDSDVVALNVVGTVSRPKLSKSTVSELLRAYKADKAIREDFENTKLGRFEKSLDGILYAVENGKRS